MDPDPASPRRTTPHHVAPDHETPDHVVPAMPPVRHSTGTCGEALAAEHLANLGLEVVARNWRIATGSVRGELDLVALDHGAAKVVVVEVKTRRGGGFGGPLAAVDGRKRAKLRRVAMAFMAQASLPYREVRFDVIGVRLDTRHLHHVMDAL